MNKIAVITCMEHEGSATISFEQELIKCFCTEKTSLLFFHQSHSNDQIIDGIQSEPSKEPLHVVFHSTCKVQKIVETMRLLKDSIGQHYVKFYYRKKDPSEYLQPSMQRITCFTKLQKEFGIAA